MESVTHFDCLNMEPLLERNIGVVPVRDVNLRAQKAITVVFIVLIFRGGYNPISINSRCNQVSRRIRCSK
jgi:hypothetical protein